MSQRALLIVAIIAAALLALVVFAPDTANSPATQRSLLLPELAPQLENVEQVDVIGPGAQPIATLLKTEQGWTVRERDGYAADLSKIRTLLVALSEAHTIEAKTADPNYYERLGVQSMDQADATGVAVGASYGGGALPTVILGDSVGASYRYARRADQAGSFLIDRSPEVPRDTSQWLVTDIMDIRGTRIQQVTISHEDGEQLLVSKTSSTQNNFDVANVPEDRELLYPGVANVIGNSLRELKFEDVAAAQPQDAGTASVTEFKTFDGLVVTVSAVPDGEEYWLSFAASFDADQAIAFASEAVDEPLAGAAAGADPRQEVEEINARLANWRYRIASHQHDQMTRRMADLLKARS
jgi:hypothetical protein